MTDKIVISSDDFRRLKSLIRAACGSWRWRTYANALERVLRWADILPPLHVPGDAVTMNTRVRLRDVDSGLRSVQTMAYPHHTGGDSQAVSVLSPMGTAMLGARVGDVVCARTPQGIRCLEVERILYQPEAAGDLHL